MNRSHLKQSSGSAPTRRPSWNLLRKLLTRERKGRNILVPSLQPGIPRRSVSRSIVTCARSMEGAYTTHNTCDCHRFEKDGKEKSNFCATKKGGKKANPINQNFVQLSEKINKLKKVLKKSCRKTRKRRYKDSDSDSE